VGQAPLCGTSKVWVDAVTLQDALSSAWQVGRILNVGKMGVRQPNGFPASLMFFDRRSFDQMA